MISTHDFQKLPNTALHQVLSLCLHDLTPCIQKDGDSGYPEIMLFFPSFDDNVQLNNNKEIKGCRWCFPNLPKSISAMLELTGLFSLPGSLGISSGTDQNIFILDVCALSQTGAPVHGTCTEAVYHSFSLKFNLDTLNPDMVNLLLKQDLWSPWSQKIAKSCCSLLFHWWRVIHCMTVAKFTLYALFCCTHYFIEKS